ncbi:hypothetical protein BCB68_10330 [Leptotrichia sp. oral taxon 498]|nr:hypothetical protein BCB68_10330 [Leptotrichia sp. oral taxon 498]
MMTNNLQILKKNLKSFAKRVKDFKYTDSALIVFLLTGLIGIAGISFNLYSAENEIEAQTKAINTSVLQLKKDFKRARQENNKLLRNTNLELIQLMEQGDHVVKSNWGSWQFGANEFYNDWHTAYKGRNDKKDEGKYVRNKSLSRYEYDRNAKEDQYTSGNTRLKLDEADREHEVSTFLSASLRTLSVNKKPPVISIEKPSGGLPPFKPRTIPTPNLPKIPDDPKITVLDPPDLTFNGTGFGQGDGPILGQTTLSLENFDTYDTTAPVTISMGAAGRSMTGGKINVTTAVPSYTGATTLNPGTATSGPVFFISDAANHSVMIKGDYDLTRNDANSGSMYFVSLNPYDIGNKGATDTDKTYELAGNLTLHGTTSSTSTGVLMGFEHQLLTYYRSGTANATSILKNSGNITLADGNNLIGIQIDTEYSSGQETTSGFIKQPQTVNDGKIIINSQRSIGIDYGYYDGAAPNTKLTLGNIEVNGKNNYGFRMKSYSNPNYYNLTDITGGAGKKITVKGTNNIGVSVAQGTSTGDPLSKVTGLNIEVGGTGNVGFFRNSQGSYANPNAMVLDNTKMNSISFLGDAKESALIRSDKEEIKLDQDITVGKIGIQNTLLQAGKTGTVRLGSGRTVTSTSSDEFYGMTAGSFGAGTTGATIINDGTLVIGGNKSIAMAVDNGNSGESSGTITYTGNNASAIYNKGLFHVKAGSTTSVTGSGDTGIYNSGTLKLDGTVTMNLKDGSTGIFSDKGTITSVGNNVTISIDDSAIPAGVSKGVAIYARGGANVTLHDANLTIKKGASGVVSDGSNLDLTNSKIDYDGDGYAIYNTNSGKVDLTNATLTLRGKAVGFQKDMSIPGSITTTGTKVDVFSDDVTVMNLTNVTGPLNLNGLDTNLSTLVGGIIINNTDPFGITYSKYKLASIDGLNTYEIDKDLDKTLAITGADKDAVTFVENLLVQRGILNVQAGKKVTSHLNTADLTKIGTTSVVGLDMSSSSLAKSNTETQINLASGSVVSADRTDDGNGAIGLYTNYGKITTAAGSIINVEKSGLNAANDSAVGIYAVNGSEVESSGDINVSGNKSIGILGLAYREDNGVPVGAEFGAGATNQGVAHIMNKGNITLDGASTFGLYVSDNNGAGTSLTATATNANGGKLNLSGDKAVGIYGNERVGIENAGDINLSGNGVVGMFAGANSTMKNTTTGNINMTSNTQNVGMYTDSNTTVITNDGHITGNNDSLGVYGYAVNMGPTGQIKVGNAGVGIYSKEGNLNLAGGSKITVGTGEAVGVFTDGATSRTMQIDSDMDLGDTSFGVVDLSTAPTNINVGSATVSPSVSMGKGAKFIYTNNNLAHVTNYAPIASTGNNTYGIYSPGTIDNYGNINFGTGTGNVGIYLLNGGIAENHNGAAITIGGSNLESTPAEYGMGMATANGTIINSGTINVVGEDGIGMFASGSNSKAINYGTINLTGDRAIGMYIDNNAVGENWGTITASGGTGIMGFAVQKGGIIKNYGQIIIDGSGNQVGYLGTGGLYQRDQSGTNPRTGSSQTGSETLTNGGSGASGKASLPTTKTTSGIKILAPAGATKATIIRLSDGKILIPDTVTTNALTPTPTAALVTNPMGTTSIVDLTTTGLGSIPSNSGANSGEISLYVDTSGVNYTKPIKGLQYLAGLGTVNLLFGTEAARYTGSKYIEVTGNILQPYTDAIQELSNLAGGPEITFKLNGTSLTWFTTATGLLGNVYMVKIPYTVFAADEDTYNFLDGLEQRYGVEGVNTREKILYNKLNDIGKGETKLLAQAVDEMKGHQYANVQHRINETGNILDKEISYLNDEWRNPTKKNNKMKAFSSRNEYNTNTSGIYDYNSNAFGVAYVHENEDVRLGHSSGWYAGAVTNHFKFKDLSKSTEQQTMLKAGIFKTMSPAKDHNGSLQWTVSGDVFTGINEMKRKFWIVDDTFEAKSNYYTYGAALKNELGYDIRLTERAHLRPYGALKMEYGRFSNIKEKEGQMRLEVDGNDYFSIKPEVGMEFKYIQPMALKTNLTVGLSAAYENELGKVEDVNNKARVRYTTADWYNLTSEKEDRHGNGKFDLNIGVDNTRFGVTVNAGYDTKGNNVRGGIGFRVIY